MSYIICFVHRYKRNGQLLELRDRDLEEILNTPANERETIYCYANNAE